MGDEKIVSTYIKKIGNEEHLMGVTETGKSQELDSNVEGQGSASYVNKDKTFILKD